MCPCDRKSGFVCSVCHQREAARKALRDGIVLHAKVSRMECTPPPTDEYVKLIKAGLD